MWYTFAALLLAAGLSGTLDAAEEFPPSIENFEQGVEEWLPTDPQAWTIKKLDDGTHAYHLLGNSKYTPPHRSPFNISLLRGHTYRDFTLTARVMTLQTSRGHRDMCLFFGYENPARFYYVHLGEKTDPHSNQIFIVNDSPRTAISETTSDGTPWKDGVWHKVKLARRLSDGLIRVYFDDMTTPVMTAHDKTFGAGRIGLGSFDDFGLWDDIEIVPQYVP